MSETVDYLYCVVPASFDLGRGVAGIDEAPVRLVREQEISALISTLDGAAYAADTIARRVADLDWLKPRAVAHDRVITWASDRATTVPMPLWTLFANDTGVVAVLRDRYDALLANLERLRDAREYTVRVFATADGIAAVADSWSPALAEMERSAAAASPGQAYLLRRKIDLARKTEVRAIARRLVDETYARLADQSLDAVREPVPLNEGDRGGDGRALLNASFLVVQERYDDFRRVLTDLATHYHPAGARFDFTGPWPAYHFVRS